MIFTLKELFLIRNDTVMCTLISHKVYKAFKSIDIF